MRFVLLSRAAARPGSRERTHLDPALLLPDEPLGRGAHQRGAIAGVRKNMYGDGFTTRRAR